MADMMQAARDARQFPPPDERRCKAHNRQGERCGNTAIHGGRTCRMHGGAAPQVKRKAQMRLAELVDPAIGTLAREMVNQSGTPMSRLRAAENVLDRAGYPRRLETDTEAAREVLLNRLLALRERASNPTPPPPDPGTLVIEGEVVDGTDPATTEEDL